MNGVLELVFERVPPNQLAPLFLGCIYDQENVSEAVQDGANLSPKSVFDPAYWSNIASASEDTACNLNLRTLRIGWKPIARATLRIIHYGDANDLSVLLSSTDCKQGDIFTSEEIYQWAKEISEEYGVEDFFGGLEPASDVRTQLFSKNGVGPVQTL